MAKEIGDSEDSGGFVWLDYPEWADDPTLIDGINQQIDQENKETDEKVSAIYDELGADKVNEMSDEEWSKALEGIPSHIGYQSKYKVFQETRQGNGLILMITVLLGSVFFISLHQSSISACLRILTRTALTIALCMCLVFHQKNGIKFCVISYKLCIFANYRGNDSFCCCDDRTAFIS